VDTYDIGCEHGQWTATSRDDGKRTFTGDTPDELNRAVRTDWMREGHTVRSRDDTPEELDRACAAVQAWRAANPTGTAEQEMT
jgi:hypothetical protein